MDSSSLYESNKPIICTPKNLDPAHTKMEMVLNSFFDDSYSPEEYGLIAENGQVEYRYTKSPDGCHMSVRNISLSKGRRVFKLSFSAEPFVIRRNFVENKGLQNYVDWTAVI